jgi:hypothetical protein
VPLSIDILERTGSIRSGQEIAFVPLRAGQYRCGHVVTASMFVPEPVDLDVAVSAPIDIL